MTGRPFFERRDWEEEIESQIEKMSRISSSLKISVTRSGKISPLWQNFKSIRLFFEGLFCIGNGFEHNWANFYEIGQIFIVVDGPILKRLFRHLVTLLKIPSPTEFSFFFNHLSPPSCTAHSPPPPPLSSLWDCHSCCWVIAFRSGGDDDDDDDDGGTPGDQCYKIHFLQ